jgi:hypothetical protein
MKNIIVYLEKSDKKDKKFKVTIVRDSERNKTVHFGASGYSDYTKHKDEERMKRYDNRHKTRENWTKSGIDTAGFWSKWILWSKPSLKEAKEYTEKKFNITIKNGSPPDSIKKSLPKSRKVSKSIHKSNNKVCDEGKIINPKTGRCVKKDGKIGKELLKSRHKSNNKVCNEGKIINPKTRRCVKKDGKIGKELLKSRR